MQYSDESVNNFETTIENNTREHINDKYFVSNFFDFTHKNNNQIYTYILKEKKLN